ncbi:MULTISPECIES: GGDEF domain-containing protein [unclassified Rhizobium]|uniref:GGDEF domain-containing protein n=1 Tax=unclassified Rhizobium TaxID=2613769 RepID=UPI00135CA5BC|nr:MULTISPECIES: GGDEF domain-containing protein [unclassified Rhizobium]
MDVALLSVGLFRSIAYSSLVILAYSVAIRVSRSEFRCNLLVGCLFGVVSVATLTDPVHFGGGISYDGRVAVLALAYTFAGAVGSTITLLVACGCRLLSDGQSANAEIVAILATTLIGYVIAVMAERRFSWRFSRSFTLALIAPWPMMFSVWQGGSVSLTVFLEIALPFVAINAIGIMLLYDLLSNERKRWALFQALERDAAVDPLTRLANRRAFYAQASSVLEGAVGARADFAILMIDIDHFKLVNDTHGHDTGDDVLVAIAHAISTCVRKSDVVARFGGEEFAVLLPGATLESGQAIAEQIRISVERTTVLAGPKAVTITISLGIVAGNYAQLSIKSALKTADEALYEAKRNGRNRVEFAAAA